MLRRPLKPQDTGLKAPGDHRNGIVEKTKPLAPLSSTQAFKVSLGGLLFLVLLYAPVMWLARRSMYQKHVTPLPASTALHKFSQERAMAHILQLAGNIRDRQQSSSGLQQAFEYVESELRNLQIKASPELRVEIDDSFATGSFNMVFLGHSISNTYRNLRNLAVRVSAQEAQEGEAALLVNGHLDGPLGSPGAADCASCVATMLEVFRYIVDTNWIPPSPIVFLFNGAEELFLLGAHGFITTHKWRDSFGAVINIEASGASGPDLVVQSGPGTWPSRVYAQSAVYPMANTAAQDVFPLIPGDTDYRVFSQDFSDIPGLDILFILDGYVYHTGYDRPEKVGRESLQARGENLISLLQAFTSAPELKNSTDRATNPEPVEKRPIFFDVFGQWMVIYSQKVAVGLHLLPLGVVLLIPNYASKGVQSTVNKRIRLVLVGLVVQTLGCVLATVLPLFIAILRLSVSSTAMTWFAHPWIAYLMFVPASLAGLLLPRAIWYGQIKISNEVEQKELDWGSHWGGVALNALASAGWTLLGVGSGYLNFYWALFMMPALSIFQAMQRTFGKDSVFSMLGYVLPGMLPAAYICYYMAICIQFITEKMGMSGTFPLPYAFYVADAILAVVVGFFVSLAVSPLLPILGNWIAKPPAIRFLLYLSIGSAAISSQLFPYSAAAPKRVVMGHSFRTSGPDEVLKSSYNFATIDPNPMKFVWKNVRALPQALQMDTSTEAVIKADPNVFLALYPISRLLTQAAEIPASISEGTKKHLLPLPHLRVIEAEQGDHTEASVSSGRRRVHLEINLGALDQVWSTVMNITGPLASWSFADGKLPKTESIAGGPPSYISRLTGDSTGGRWQFWLEAYSLDPLRIELAVLDQQVDVETQSIIDLFPSWVAVVAGSMYLSTYFV
jgi:hypothetical protein